MANPNLTRVSVPVTQPDGSVKPGVRLKNLSRNPVSGQLRDADVSLGSAPATPVRRTVSRISPEMARRDRLRRIPAPAEPVKPYTKYATAQQHALFAANGYNGHADIFADDILFEEWDETMAESIYL